MPAPAPGSGFYLIDSAARRDPATFWASLRQLVLPAVTLGALRDGPDRADDPGAMLGVLGSDFMRTARASGLRVGTVLFVPTPSATRCCP